MNSKKHGPPKMKFESQSANSKTGTKIHTNRTIVNLSKRVLSDAEVSVFAKGGNSKK